MAKIKSIEKKIWDVECFDVTIRFNGADVRDDKTGFPQYKFERAAKNDMTVGEWKNNRFNQQYVGYDVDVLDGEGQPVAGQTKLGTVRDTYEEDN